MTEERRKGDRRIPPAVAQHLVEERGELLARIERLESEAAYAAAGFAAAREEISALKSHPSAGVVDERADFEAHIKSEGGMMAGWGIGRKGDTYEYPPMAARWESWQARALLNPCRAQSVPDGYVMVPDEPTDGMLNAGKSMLHKSNGRGAREKCSRIFMAMISDSKGSDDGSA